MKNPVCRSCLFLFLFVFFAPPVLAANWQHAAVVSSQKEASEVGQRILKKGGTAADAAIAMAFTLGVIEPQHSGIGGGGVLLYYEKARNQVTFIDYMPVAPFKTSEPEFNAGNNNKNIQKGTQSVAIPGFLLGMKKTHDRFGKLSWQNLLEPAIDFASSKTEANAELIEDANKQKQRLKTEKFFINHWANPLSQKKPSLEQNELAQTLRVLQKNGSHDFYTGDLSKKLLQEFEKLGISISKEDLAKYQVQFQQATKLIYKNHILYLPQSPNYGSAVLAQFFAQLKGQNLKWGEENFLNFLKTESEKFYESQNKKLEQAAPEDSQTTQIITTDPWGNFCVMTNTLNDLFGSGVYLEKFGFILNNGMEAYPFDLPDTRYSIKKRERAPSALTPVIVFNGLDPYLLIGTTGGSTIPQNIFQTLFLAFEEGRSVSSAIREAKIYHFPGLKRIIYEEGFLKDHLKQASDYTLEQSITTAGNTQAIEFANQKPKTHSDKRGNGEGETLRIKID